MNGARKRPCSECGTWFTPNPRVRFRQKTCGKTTCKQKRHRKADECWRRRNPGYDRGRRLQGRLVAEKKAGVVPRPRPLERVDWDLVQDEMGIKAAEILADLARVLAAHAVQRAAQTKDAIWADVLEFVGKTVGLPGLPGLPPRQAQDEMQSQAFKVAGETVGLPESEVPRRTCAGASG
jgi:hypothetical protein